MNVPSPSNTVPDPTAGAVIFDLDGTLTVATLDFTRIRSEIGIADGPILEAIDAMEDPRRRRAQAILERHEEQAARTARAQPQAAATVDALRGRGFRVGILTRNARRWAAKTLETLGLEVDAMVCREDGALKPDPAGVWALCARFGVSASRTWMVGDYRFDIEAGRRAGARTALFVAQEPAPSFADQADVVIRRLPEVVDLVSREGSGFAATDGEVV